MTTPTPPRRGRPPKPGGPLTSSQRSAKSRSERQVTAVELGGDTIAMLDEAAARVGLSDRPAAVRWALDQAVAFTEPPNATPEGTKP